MTTAETPSKPETPKKKLYRVQCKSTNRQINYNEDVWAFTPEEAKQKVIKSLGDGTVMLVKGTQMKITVKELRTDW